MGARGDIKRAEIQRTICGVHAVPQAGIERMMRKKQPYQHKKAAIKVHPKQAHGKRSPQVLRYTKAVRQELVARCLGFLSSSTT